jgi:hypothetical protein
MNPDRRGGKPATNRLSYGAAHGPKMVTMKVLSFGIDCTFSGRSLPTFQKNVLSHASGSKSDSSKRLGRTALLACYLISLLFDTENGGSIFLRHISKLVDYMGVTSQKVEFFLLSHCLRVHSNDAWFLHYNKQELTGLFIYRLLLCLRVNCYWPIIYCCFLTLEASTVHFIYLYIYFLYFSVYRL